MLNPERFLEDLAKTRAQLLAFLKARNAPPSPNSGFSPVLLGSMEQCVDPERFTESSLTPAQSQELAERLRQRPELLSAWLSLLAAEPDLCFGLRSLVLEGIESRFPLTGRPMQPLLLGERAIVGTILANNLTWWLSAQSARRAPPTWMPWLRPAAETENEEKAMETCRRLLPRVRWELPEDPAAGMLLHHALLEPLLLAAQGMAGRGKWHRSAGQRAWLELLGEWALRCPVTRLLCLDSILGFERSVFGDDSDRPEKYVWDGLDKLFARDDFDAAGPLLQRFLDSMAPLADNSSARKMAQSLEQYLRRRGLADAWPVSTVAASC